MPEAAQVPILVGVTGHRDPLPDARPQLEAAVHEALVALDKQTRQHGRQIGTGPLHVVTGLAEGADQLVADVAERYRLPLIAVVPMPLEDYLGKFKTTAAKEGLRHHWKRAILQIELPWVGDSRVDELQYEQLGLVLSRHMHVLLALWDGLNDQAEARRGGEPNTGRGGCAHVIDMRQQGERLEALPRLFRDSCLFFGPPPLLELTRSGPIIHVVTPRNRGSHDTCPGDDGRPSPAGAVRWWSDQSPAGRRAARGQTGEPAGRPEQESQPEWTMLPSARKISSYLTADLFRIRDLNADLADLARAEPEQVHRHQEFLCPETDLESVGATEFYPLNWLRRLQASVDVSAAKFQRNLVGEWSPGLPLAAPLRKAWAERRPLPPLGALYVFATAVPAAALIFEVYAHFRPNWFALVAYLAVVGVTGGYYLLWVRRRKWQERFQDYRALAEALRVQFYWAAAGVPVAASDNYLGHQSDEIGWIRQALRGPALWGMTAGLAVRKPVLLQHWIDDQHRYFLGKGDRKSGKAWENSCAAERMKRITLGLVAAILVPAAVLSFAHIMYFGWELPEKLPERVAFWVRLLVVLLGLLPALAAFFVVIAEGRSYKEHSHAYARAGQVFAQAAKRAEKLSPEDISEAKELALELGRGALDENASWLENHRARPIASRAG
jgi:hypothetical protein